MRVGESPAQDQAHAAELARAALPAACRDVGLLWIDGRWRPSSTGATFETVNPTTGEAL
jgi:hypothetical protein